MKLKLIFPSIFISCIAFAQSQVTGYVYEDTNKNGLKDKKEIGLANVSVSNGEEVVLTDKEGKYVLPLKEDQIIFVIKPSGFQTKINSKFLPEYYYNHKPSGSPSTFKYKGVAPTGALPKEVNFPLYKNLESKDFQILVFGDPQPYNLKEIDYFKRGIIDEVKKNKRQAVFGMSLGDLVGNDLSLHPAYIDAVKEIGLPWYNIIGNHDMNFEATEDKMSDETFEAHFGPTNYAFNYGNVHFINLDDILYPDPRDGKEYYGGLREDQLKFIENDLKLVDKNKLIVVSFHIQMMPEAGEDHFRMQDRKRLFEILKPFKNVLMMSAHTHKQSQIFYTNKHGWEGADSLHEFNVGTTSGDWYSGTIDEKGVPQSTMRDGTYRGYLFVNFKDNQYTIDYKAAGMPEDVQMSISVPKVIPYQSKNSAKIVANFFMGSKKDKVEYRIDGGNWKPMEYTELIDPSFAISVYQWDTTQELLQGRRPSNPEYSKHIWIAPFGKLALGAHRVEVRATDRYGKTSISSESFEVKNAKEIP